MGAGTCPAEADKNPAVRSLSSQTHRWGGAGARAGFGCSEADDSRKLVGADCQKAGGGDCDCDGVTCASSRCGCIEICYGVSVDGFRSLSIAGAWTSRIGYCVYVLACSDRDICYYQISFAEGH